MTIDEIIGRFPGAKPDSNGWQVKCPAHEDKVASLSIHEEPGGKILVHCHAGCEVDSILRSVGLQMSDLFPAKSDSLAKVGQPEKSKRRKFGEKKIVAEYDYADESGTLLFQVCRTDPKGFIQRRRVVTETSAKWVWDIKGVTKVIFRLPQVKAAINEGRAIYIVEGEKDVLNVEKLGFTATCNSGGAGKWLKGYSKHLVGADVVILPDNDDPGLKHAEDVALSLIDIAKRIRVVKLEGLAPKGDVSDWILTGGTAEALLAMQEKTDDYKQWSVYEEYKTPEGISRIGVCNVPLREIGRAAIRALSFANSPPCLFLKGGSMVRYRETELSAPLIEKANDAIIGSRLADVADFIFETKEIEKQVNPPKDVIHYVMSSAELPFPKLLGVTESPMLRPDGTILSRPGYDAVSGYYYRPPDGFEMPDISDDPTDEQVRDAVALIQETICDFPFVDEASRTNTIALMLTPLIRGIVPTVPIALIDATNWGTGKSLLSEVCATISCGNYEMSTVPSDSEEWRKRITALLSDGKPFIILDNVKGMLSSDSLASVLTSARWSDRKLGSSETVVYQNRATWVATGNNLQIDGDMGRRGYLIELDAKCARPYQRDYEFKHPKLVEWLNLNRGMLIGALFTIVRAWYSAGQPSAHTPAMGSFEMWVEMVGGILAHAGLPDFHANREKLYRGADTESTQWEGFLARWVELYGNQPKTVSQIKDDLTSPDGFEGVLPEVLSYAIRSDKVNPNKIGRAFRAKEGTYFGDQDLRLCRAGEHHRAILWTVASAARAKSGEYDEFGELDSAGLARVNNTAHTHIENNTSLSNQREETRNTRHTHPEFPGDGLDWSGRVVI